MKHTPPPFRSDKYSAIASEMKDKEFRNSYVAAHTKRFLAHQLRAFRGDLSQTEFGEIIGQKQSAVCRFENPNYGRETLQTLFDIAQRLDVAFIGRFVDFPTFLTFTENMSDDALKPTPYSEVSMDDFVASQNIAGLADFHLYYPFPSGNALMGIHIPSGQNQLPILANQFAGSGAASGVAYVFSDMNVEAQEQSQLEMAQLKKQNIELKKENTTLKTENVKLKLLSWPGPDVPPRQALARPAPGTPARSNQMGSFAA